MLSIFPEFYNYSFIAPFVLRIALGAVAIKYGYRGIFASKIFGGALFVSGLLLILGLLVQPAAIAVIILFVAAEFLKTRGGFIVPRSKTISVLMIATALSLLFLGPGILSFDLPL